MEQFVLGIFQEQLSKFIVGFRKEQVNANLLNGKGEIIDVSLNCSVLNDTLATITPFFELESISISKLSFHVTSWANLKKAPLCVVIEHVHVVIVEPLHFFPKEKRRSIKQISSREYYEILNKTKSNSNSKKQRGSYNLLDRILDNIQIDIQSVQISFQPRGKFKTRRYGPWTPPCLLLKMQHVLYQSVDEFGTPASPDDCWKHNKFQGRTHQQTVQIYKKASMDVQLQFKSWKQEIISIIPEAKVEVQIMFHKRVRDAAILAIQVDASLNQIELSVDASHVPLLMHAITGVQYCLAKDRAFDDPLVTNQSFEDDGYGDAVEIQLHEHGVSGVDGNSYVTGLQPFGDTEDDLTHNQDAIDSDDDSPPAGLDHIAFDDTSMNGTASLEKQDESFSEDGQANTESPSDGPTYRVANDSKQSFEVNGPKSFIHSDTPNATKATTRDRPIIVLPTGIVVHERISLSLSIHNCTVRGTYEPDLSLQNSQVLLSVRGLIAEFIWPKNNCEKGAYFQMSLSHISLQEMYGQRIRFLMLGGTQNHVQKTPVEGPSQLVKEIQNDENFPLFEDRYIRPDPWRLRNTFPAQAIGVKSTIDFLEKGSSPQQEVIMVLNEIGLDEFDITLDAESWCRLVSFAKNERGVGFDPRWTSGDWSDILTTDVLVHPAQPLNLADHVQGTKDIFVDENALISSDLFNVTARVRNLQIRAPAAISKDVRSCDIAVNIGELMIIISSALPRTCLTGKVGSSIIGDDPALSSKIDFPNDPSDICYDLENTQDPLMRQTGTETSRVVSTFRSQLTMKKFAIKFLPAIPFCNQSTPHQLLEPLDLNVFTCFEGERPETCEENLMKLILFLSAQIHRVVVNLDFDLLSGAISTGLYHMQIAKNVFTKVDHPDTNAETQKARSDVSYVEGDTIIHSATSRRVLTKRQLEKSKTTGGLTLSLSFQLAELSLSLWRQNVPIQSKFRASVNEIENVVIDDFVIPLIQVLKVHLGAFEFGVEAYILKSDRRVILKGSLSTMIVDICDFDKICLLYPKYLQERQERETFRKAQEESNEYEEQIHYRTQPTSLEPEFHPIMVELLALGKRGMSDAPISENIVFRIEERMGESRTITISLALCAGGTINLYIHEIEMIFLLCVEALLLPTGVIHSSGNKGTTEKCDVMAFPQGSIGALLLMLADCQVRSKVGHLTQAMKGEIETENLGGFMEALILSKLPKNTKMFLAHISLKNLVWLVPQTPTKDADPNASWFGLSLTDTTVITRYFEGTHVNDVSCHPILTVLARSGSQWGTLFLDHSPGFRCSITTAQGLYTAEPTMSGGKFTNCLIPMFTLHGIYIPSKIDVSLGNSTLSVTDIWNMNKFYKAVILFMNRTKTAKHRIDKVVAAMKGIDLTQGDPAELNHLVLFKPSIDYRDVESSVRATREYLRRLGILIASHDLKTRSAIKILQKKIHELEFQVFTKERERLSALALVASQAAGWLRMGGSHTHGQRAQPVANMWRYFMVLRKSLLIVYSAPGKPTPLDIICMEGASLHVLAGGRNKVDVRHGFAIVERSGKARLFVALNGAEYALWVKELHHATTIYSQQPNDGQIDASVHDRYAPSSTLQDAQREHIFVSMRRRTSSTDSDGARYSENDHFAPRRGEKVRTSLSNLTAAAKNKLTVARLNRKKSDDSLGNDASLLTRKIVACDSGLRNEFVDEKDLPPERSDECCHEDIEENEELNRQNSDDPPTKTNDDEHSSSTRHGVQMAKRFATLRTTASSRVGGVVQAAKEKTKAVAEQRRKPRVEARFEESRSEVPEETGDADEVGRRLYLGGFKNRLGGVATSFKRRLDKGETTQASRMNSADLQTTASPETSVEDPSNGNEDLNLQPVESGAQLIPDWDQSRSDSNTAPIVTIMDGLEKNREKLLKEVRVSSVEMVGSNAHNDKSTESGTDHPRFGMQVPNLDASMKVIQAQSSNEVQPKRDHFGGGRIPVRNRFLKSTNNDALEMKVEGTQLRGIFVGDEKLLCKLSEQLPPIPEIRLEAMSDWIVHATSHRFQPGDVMPKMPSREHDILEGFIESSSNTPSDDDMPADYANGLTTFLSAERGYRLTLIRRKFRLNREIKPLGGATTIFCTLSDVLDLFYSVSEPVANMAPRMISKRLHEIRNAVSVMDQGLADSLGLSALDCLKLSGSLLGGLLETSTNFECTDAFLEYECEVLTEFLNSALTCPLPHEARMSLKNFFKIETCDVPITMPSAAEPPNNKESQKLEAIIESTTETIFGLTAAIQAELLRVECKGMTTQRETSSRLDHEETNPSMTRPDLEPLLPSTIFDSLRDGLHNALMIVMAERDEAQARLIASNVLHMHEVEQQQKKIGILNEKLIIAQSLAHNLINQDLGFVNPFQNNNSARDQARNEAHEKMRMLTDRIVQDTDAELIALCQQLSAEIASKTTKSLEIVRLKETHKIEQTQDSVEKLALQAELKRVKGELAAQKVKFDLVTREAQDWKAANEK